MTTPGRASEAVRSAYVAGSFYPGEPAALRSVVAGMLPARAARPAAEWPMPIGLLVPHAGLRYSGRVAATAWSMLMSARITGTDPGPAPTIVLLGTNHVAAWLEGIGVWASGAWSTPLGRVLVDEEVASEILHLGGPFVADRDAHGSEHSIEVQLPFLQVAVPGSRIVPLAVAAGTGADAIAAGTALGRLLGRRAAMRAAAVSPAVVLAISTDMAHYPPRAACERVTAALLPSILALDPVGLAAAEREVRRWPEAPACGMCGIQPAVVGLAALRAMGVERGELLAAATSADTAGPADRAVGYLAVAFPG